jgi:LacI family transcriptional regulator
MEKKITINDVAQKSGVSVSTVSLVFNQRPGVASETRARVFEVAEDLGYVARGAPVATKSTSLATIGMILKRAGRDQPPQENPFYSRIVAGIEDACRLKGINLLYATMPVDDDNHPTQIPTLFESDDLDGVVMVGAFLDRSVETAATRYRRKLVLVDGYSDTGSFDAVVSDNFRAAYQAVEYLIAHGHHHIGFAGAPPNAYPSLNDRRNGYLRALKEHGIGDAYEANFNIASHHGQDEIARLLCENPAITALFCVNDEIAIAALRAAKTLQRPVPQSLSVIGYDDIYLSLHTSPPLTTMHVDTVAMGRAAVQLLALRVENPDMARLTLTIHPTLVERDSVSRVNG